VDGGTWFNAVMTRTYSKNITLSDRYDWLTADGNWSYSYAGYTNVGLTGIKTYYGCYNMADNARELTESCILGHGPALSLNPSEGRQGFGSLATFMPYPPVKDATATELLTPTDTNIKLDGPFGGIR